MNAGHARVRSLDHLVLAVAGLESAADTYRRLGYHVRPVARHLELGSSNCIVHFPRTYLELFSPGDSDRGIVDAHRHLLAPYLERLRAGEGIAHVSLDSRDLAADRGLMQAHGLEPTPIVSARRRIVRPDGRPDETDSSFFYLWRDDNRYLSLFLSEHRKPATIFIPEYEAHPNAARECTRVVYVSRDPAADVHYFATLFGQRPHSLSGTGFTVVGASGAAVEVLSLPAAIARYGASLPPDPCGPFAGVAVAMHFSSHALDRSAAHLSAAGVPFERADAALIVPAAAARGCVIVFER
jgi:hypothetical protein